MSKQSHVFVFVLFAGFVAWAIAGQQARSEIPAGGFDAHQSKDLSSNARASDCAKAQSQTFIDVISAPSFVASVVGGSAVVAAVINVVSFYMSAWLTERRHKRATRDEVYEVALSREMSKERFQTLQVISEGVYCLLIRYGSDPYIEKLASDQERYEGRLKNAVIKIDARRDDEGNAIFTLRLPVHKRIGTQFKCFAVAKDAASIPALVEFLKNCERVHSVSPSQGVDAKRIYFLLDRFAPTTSVDGWENNIALPE